MASFNKVILVGNLTRDVELRYIPSGAAVTDLGIAVNRSWFDKKTESRKEETTFVDATLFGRSAEVAAEFLKKGSSILVEGRLHLEQWEDKTSGNQRSKLKVICEQMTMLGGRDNSGGQSHNKKEESPALNVPPADINNDDDIPF